MKRFPAKYLLLFIVLFGQACSSWKLESIEPTYYKIDSLATDASIETIILPYKHYTDSLMGAELTVLPMDLVKEKPNGNLGIWMADACRAHAARKLNRQVDIALLNQGGIRRPYLKKGPVTLGMMYELMPFDNLMVVLSVKGSLLKDILKIAEKRGGEPLSGAEVTMHSEFLEVKIDGIEIDNEKEYTLVTNDYMYNGGDGYGVLQNGSKPEYLGLIRDAWIEEIGLTAEFPGSGTLRWRWYE